MNPPESAPLVAIPAAASVAEPNRLKIEGGPVHPVGPRLVPALAPAMDVVQEWRDYVVRCEGAAWLEVGSHTIAAVVEGVFLHRFENQLGLSRLRALDLDGREMASRHVEVVSPKLGDAEASLGFLRAMLADLTSEEGSLAFLPRAQTSRTVRTVQRPPSLLIQYFHLLTNAEAIIEATRLIERSPHRVLDDEAQHVSLFDLTEIDTDVVLQLVQGNAAWDRSARPPRLRAAREGVWFRVAREGFDSAEYRFVRAVALELGEACDDVLAAPWLQAGEPAVARRRETLTRLRTRLRQHARAPMFDEVGPMHRVPAASRVLQRRAGYRDLNLQWQAFLTSREPVWQRMQEAIDLRDVATLYEYWVWFALVREIGVAFGGVRPEIGTAPASQPGLQQGLVATFQGLGRLTYNASQKAYSGVWLRPDYLWEPEAGGKVAFDAKFRLAWDGAPLDVSNEDTTDPVARAKADDLVKMHAYRDAIPGLRAAVVIYPGHVAEFRPVAGERLAGVTVADVLRGEIDGVGAIPMRPEGVDG